MTSQQGGGRQPAGIRDVARLAGEYLSIATTMVNHDTPAAPPLPVETSDDLAALHRELAANVPWDISVMAGAASDRNVELRVAPPFPLKRLPGA